MQSRPKSLLMPGAFYTDNFTFIHVYYKNDYNFCILAEKPALHQPDIKSFEYFKYNVEQKIPGLFDSSSSAAYVNYRIPKIQLMNPDELSAELINLANAGYRQVFAGELLNEHVVVLDEKKYFYDDKFRFENITKIFFNLDHKNLIINQDKKISLSSLFESGLKELNLGLSTDEIIDFSSYHNAGQLGDGCVSAIVEAIESGSCSHLKNMTIDLTGYILSHEAKSKLTRAIYAPLCPYDLKFKITTCLLGYHFKTEIIELDNKDKALINCVTLLQFFKNNKFPSDILLYIVKMIDIDCTQNVVTNYAGTIFNRNRSLVATNMAFERLKNTLSQEVTTQLCKELSFNYFNVGTESVSQKRMGTILNETNHILEVVFQQLTHTQSTILIRNGINITQFAVTLAGSLKQGDTFNEISEENIHASQHGLVNIYFSANDSKKIDRTGKIILAIYKAIAREASPDQLEALIYDNNNQTSKMLQLLKGKDKTKIQDDYRFFLLELNQSIKELNVGSNVMRK